MSSTLAELQKMANSRWRKNRRRMIAQGKWEPFVDAQPVRERVWQINRAGMPTSALTERLGLIPSALDHLMCKRDGEYSREVRTETADAVMSYWPTLADFPDRSLIDATGTHRRVQALMALGWTQLAIARRMGVRNRSLSRALLKSRVTAELARHVASVYDELWKCGPCAGDVAPNVADRVRVDAARRGFHGPLAWDDDSIDDPGSAPQTDAEQPVVSDGNNRAARWLLGESVVLGVEDRKQVVQHMFEWTELTKEQIAARLEMTPGAAEQIWNRLKRQARIEGRPVPWRRVYALRDKTLAQNEMEEVA